jgi:hypothetical protein
MRRGPDLTNKIQNVGLDEAEDKIVVDAALQVR